MYSQRSYGLRFVWAQIGLAAVRHGDLNPVGFGVTNRMTGPSLKRIWPVQSQHQRHSEVLAESGLSPRQSSIVAHYRRTALFSTVSVRSPEGMIWTNVRKSL